MNSRAWLQVSPRQGSSVNRNRAVLIAGRCARLALRLPVACLALEPEPQRLLKVDRRRPADHHDHQQGDHHPVLLLVHPGSLDAQHDGAGDSAQKGDEYESQCPQRAQAQQVAHIVLRKAWNREQDESEKSAPVRDEEIEFIENHGRYELLHERTGPAFARCRTRGNYLLLNRWC